MVDVGAHGRAPLQGVSSHLLKPWNLLLRPAPGQIIITLEIDPELRCRAEGLRKQPGSLRRYPSLLADNLIDPLDWNPDMSGKSDLGDTQRLQEFL